MKYLFIDIRKSDEVYSKHFDQSKDYSFYNIPMNMIRFNAQTIINQMPSNDMPIEQDVPVSDSWNPEQLIPDSKSFFYYDGALPYPPCSQNWTIIVFEEIVPISLNIIDTVKYIIGPGNKNIRPTQRKPKNISIFYNSNSHFDRTQDLSKSAVSAASSTATTVPSLALQQTSWLKQNI